MTRILYGVSGEGSGHSSRAREILTHLITQGHEVKVVSYDRGYRNLKDSFDVTEVTGLSIISQDNKISTIRTLLENLKTIPDGIKSFQLVRHLLFKQFKPDCVITDFEPITAYLAGYYKIPLISLDNQHRMRYMNYKRPEEFSKDALITETVIRAMIPKPDVSLITTFHYGEVKNDHTFLFPPILRENVLALRPTAGEHILVYATAEFDSLITLLANFMREKFLIYGYDKDEVKGNLFYRSFSKTEFLQDLAKSKAVIATAGFTLITEALYLGKPYFALPMKGQFEQALNALMLEEQGFGKSSFELNADQIAAFIYSIPDYLKKLSDYPHEGNQKITQFLDKLLANHGQILQHYQRN